MNGGGREGVLEPFEADLLRERGHRRARTRAWARGALVLDAVLLAAAGAATQLGSGDAGILRVSPVWIVTYAALVLGMLQLRGLYSWRFRVSVLDDLRGILAATALAS